MTTNTLTSMKPKHLLSPTVVRTILLIVYSLIGWGLFYYQEGMSLREAYRGFSCTDAALLLPTASRVPAAGLAPA